MRMADKKELDIKFDQISFEEDPLKFCQFIYAEALERHKTLQPINVENRLFYEGQDRVLDERRNNKRVIRSALFIPELTPAIDTRVGDIISKVEEREFPVTIRPHSQSATSEEKNSAAWIEYKIGTQMRDCGYLSDILKEHITAAEIYRSPSTIKVSWENTYSKKAKLKLNPNPFGKPGVVFEDTYNGGRPYVEYLYPEEFLYQPYISIFERDSTYCMHVMWLPYHDLVARAKEQKYDLKKIEEYKDEIINHEGDKDNKESERDEVADERDVPHDNGYRDEKFLLIENYIVTYKENGSESIKQVVTFGNKHIVKKRNAPERGIKFPFIPVVANKLPGTIEGMSSVDRGKYLQRLYNEIFNSYLDGITYRIFPPFKAPTGLEFEQEPIFGPGEIWRMADPEALQPVIQNPGMLPDLPALMGAVSAKIRDVLNAQDISQGFQSAQYEKATSTKLRVAGASRRATPTHKQYGMTIIKVAEMFLALNQQYSDEKEKYVLDVVIDVPSLTNVSDPENEKQESLLLLAQAQQSPLYQNPVGQMKIRNMWEDIIRKFKKVDVDDFVITKDEMERLLNIQKEMEGAAADKRGLIEQMSLEQQSAPVQEGA